MKKQFLMFNIALFTVLQIFYLFNYAFHEYAHLEIDMLDAKYIDDPTENQEEAIIVLFIKEFQEEAALRGLDLDYSRLTYKIKDRLGHNQAFIDRSVTTLATCQKDRKHMNFLRSEINQFNLSQLRSTVFHEMGHCMLGLDHEEDFDPNGNPNILVTVDVINWNFSSPEQWNVAVNNMFNRFQQ